MPLIYRFIIIAIMSWGILTAGAYVYKPVLKPQEVSKACITREAENQAPLTEVFAAGKWIPFIIIDTYQGEER